MNTNISRGLLSMVVAAMAILWLSGNSFADTPSSNNAQANGQMMYPYGMHQGMGPGNMPYGGMGPGNMPYGGRGYMHQGGGYGGRGYGMGYGGGMMGYGMGYGGGMMGYGMGYGGMGMMQALNLSKAQQAKFRSLLREQRSARCKDMTAMFDVRDELAAEYAKDQPDPKVIGKLYNKMAQMQRNMLEQSVRMRDKMRELLNKDQKETFDRMFHGAGGYGMGYGGMGMMNMMGYGAW